MICYLEKISDAMDSVLGRLSDLQFKAAMCVLMFMPFPLAVDIIGRSLFHAPLDGCMEIEEFCMVLLLFLTLPFTERAGKHISIDFLTKYLSEGTNRFLSVLFDVLTVVFLGTASWWAGDQAMAKKTIRTAELLLPIWPFMAIVCFEMAFAAFVALSRFLRNSAAMLARKEWAGWLCAAAVAAAICLAPYWIRWAGIRIGKAELGVLGWVFMLGLLFLRFPLAYSMGLVGMLGLCLVNRKMTAGLALVGVAPYNSMMSFVMVAVPLFMLMGEITSKAGISRDLFSAASRWIGRVPGGLAMSAVAGCAGFAAICGESLPTAVTMSSVALPEMKNRGYKDDLSCGALAAGGTLGILIPPSVGFIFYSVVTEQSVGRLFMAGMIPGLVLALLFIAVICIRTAMDPSIAPAAERCSWRDKFASLRKVIGFTVIFLVIVLGIMTGIMNPTEASAIGCLAALVVAIAGGRFSFAMLRSSLEETMRMVSRLLFILAGVSILGYFLAQTHMPTQLAGWIGQLQLSPYITLGIIIAIWVVLGCVMNVIPMILLTLPALYPTVEALGFDPIWFGVLAVVVMEMGQLTPPVGIVCFAVSSVGKVPVTTVFRGIAPFFLCMCLLVLLLIFYPQMALWLPNMLFD